MRHPISQRPETIDGEPVSAAPRRDGEDTELMLRFRAGDARSFHDLYARHRGSLYRFFLRQVPRDTADDLYQETWLKVVRGAASYSASAPFAAYLYRIAHNVLVDHYRRAARGDLGGTDDLPDIADPDDPPETELDRATLKARLSAAIAALPPPQREAFLLHEETELTLDEIAAVVGTNRETIKSRLRYAVIKLRRALAEADQPMEKRA